MVDFLEKDGEGLNLTREVVDGIINHKLSCKPSTLEGMAVNLADRIAYINHDIDDAIDGGFITFNDLPKESLEILGKSSSERINAMVYSIYRESDGKNKVEMEKHVAETTLKLREFLFERVYNDVAFKKEEVKADRMISALYSYFKENPELMPEFNYNLLSTTDVDTVVCDYLSSMSDGYVVNLFTKLFVPDKWKL